MKETKKTSNILIRETSRHHNRAESGKLKPIAPPSQDSRNSKRTTKTKVELPLDIRKNFIEAENLTIEEQLQIKK